MAGFLIWCVVAAFFVVIGFRAFGAEEPVGFWNVAKVPEVSDIKKYNHAVGMLWCISGVIFAVLGVPLLAGQNSPAALLSAVGALLWAIGVMVIYEMRIVKKYKV